MNPKKIEDVLSRLSKGECSVGEALEKLRTLPYDDLKFAKLDSHRELRKGIPEAIYSPGKTDRELSWFYRHLEFNRTFASETRMTAFTVIKHFNIIKYL